MSKCHKCRRNDLIVNVDREKHSSDDDSDFRDIQFPQDTTLQQVIYLYKSSHFIIRVKFGRLMINPLFYVLH